MSDWPLIAIRFALYVDLGLAFGLPLFGLYALRDEERSGSWLLPFSPIVPLLGVAGLLISGLGFAIMVASMAGTGIGEIDPAMLTMLLSETAMGWAFVARMAALFLIVLAGFVYPRAPVPALAVAAGAGAIALGTLAWTGHAAATEGRAGTIHLFADLLHLWAAGLWLGALFALVLILARLVPGQPGVHSAHRALAGFSRAGTLAVGTLVLTGIVNSIILVGIANVPSLVNQLYGQLLLLKLLLFGAMLVLAAANRFRLTPALEVEIAGGNEQRAVMALRLSLALETAAALAIFALVGWLGTLSPPASGG